MRRQYRVLLLAPLALVALVAAACGGESDTTSVPTDAVAVVGDDTITKDEFQRLLDQVERSYKQQNRAFPQAGTRDYETIKQQTVQYLVQNSELEQKAKELGISISDKQVDAELAKIKKQYKWSEAEYQQQLKRQGLSEEQVRNDLEMRLLSREIFNKVTSDVTVSDQDVQKYYNENRAQYETGESRDVRHILIACGSSSGTSGAATSCTAAKSEADRIYEQLKDGASFAALAKKYSDDPGSKAQGGKLTVQRGQTVAPFDQTAFLLGKGTISRPLKTQYGYHIIQPLSAVQEKKTTPFSQVRESIRTQLVDQEKQQVMQEWLADMKKEFKVRYQVGYAPQNSQQQ